MEPLVCVWPGYGLFAYGLGTARGVSCFLEATAALDPTLYQGFSVELDYRPLFYDLLIKTVGGWLKLGGDY